MEGYSVGNVVQLLKYDSSHSCNPQNLTQYGYLASKVGLQRVCKSCSIRLHIPTSLWSSLPFAIQVHVASFLSTCSMLELSAVDQDTHRRFSSRDFDSSYWYWRCHTDASLSDLLHSPRDTGMESKEIQLTVPLNSPDSVGTLSCTRCCQNRLEFVQKHAIPVSLDACFSLVHYPLVSIRVSALRHLRKESSGVSVQNAVAQSEVMASLVRCLQFGNSQILTAHGVTTEIQELLLMVSGLLLNTTQSSRDISTVFREKEGITTVLALLQNEYVNPRSQSSFMDSSPTLARLTDHPSRSGLSSPRLQSHSSLDLLSSRDPGVRKIVSYLIGLLMNLCNLEKANCAELVGLDGIELLMSLVQLTNERLMLYALETVKSCCRWCPEARERLAGCDGVIKIINAFACSNMQVVASAVALATVVTSNHSGNTRLFRLANGLNALNQIEESWSGHCSVCAAKAISNLLHGGYTLCGL